MAVSNIILTGKVGSVSDRLLIFGKYRPRAMTDRVRNALRRAKSRRAAAVALCTGLRA